MLRFFSLITILSTLVFGVGCTARDVADLLTAVRATSGKGEVAMTAVESQEAPLASQTESPSEPEEESTVQATANNADVTEIPPNNVIDQPTTQGAEEESGGKIEQETAEPAKQQESQRSATRRKRQEISIVLSVVVPTGSTTYAVTAYAGDTVEEAMQKASTKGFSSETKSFGGIGAYVTSINGLAEDEASGLYWIYYLNDTPATAGISTQQLQDGDTIEWRYEKGY